MAYLGSTLERIVLKGIAVVIAFMFSLSYAAGLPADWPGHVYVAMGGIFATVLLFTLKSLLVEDATGRTPNRGSGARRPVQDTTNEP